MTLQTDAQTASNQENAHDAQIEGWLKNLHTCTPGIIVSFDSSTQTATVQPAIQRVFTGGVVSLPLCLDVLVAFPGGGDFHMTFPVKPGNECILWFSERCIDSWNESGQLHPPAEYRMHDLSDGLCIVGLNSQPNKLLELQMDGVEIRNRSRDTYIRLTNGTIYIKGDIVHEGKNTQTGDYEQTGQIQSSGDHIAGTISLMHHLHSGVTTGSDATAEPIP